MGVYSSVGPGAGSLVTNLPLVSAAFATIICAFLAKRSPVVACDSSSSAGITALVLSRNADHGEYQYL